MKFKFRFSGRGGQGIKFLGTVLAEVAMNADYYTTLTVDYTPSVRGGPIFSDVIISTEQISYPFCDNDADIFVAIDQQGIERAVECIDEKTLSFIDANTVNNIETLIKKGKIYRVPIIKLADENKVPNSANMVSLGFISEFLYKNMHINLKEQHYLQVFNKMPEKFRKTNIFSFSIGRNLYQEFLI
jgi:Pyruvate/2-oxoacid:ferredoxin oxidoreductase gamma subunit